LADWLDTLGAHDLPVSALLVADELFADPHVRARGMIRELDDGQTIALRFPVKFSLGLPDGSDHVPELDEHEI
jgi:crotonobetainyl-CoA:carnitine CoA-transferase CaiB-like acyl-CoA transferase